MLTLFGLKIEYSQILGKDSLSVPMSVGVVDINWKLKPKILRLSREYSLQRLIK